MLKEVELIKSDLDRLHNQISSLNKSYDNKSKELQLIQANCKHGTTKKENGNVIVCEDCDKFLGHRV